MLSRLRLGCGVFKEKGDPGMNSLFCVQYRRMKLTEGNNFKNTQQIDSSRVARQVKNKPIQ